MPGRDSSFVASGEGTRPRRKSPLRARLALLGVALFLALVSGEAACRVYWKLRHDVPLTDPGRILYRHYPALKELQDSPVETADAKLNVLILGGSVMSRDWGSIEHELKEQLEYAGHDHVRVVNLAVKSHTTRDSLLKYRAVADAPFDIVILYHGINDIRANNAPPEVFRQDYGHFAWYEQANMLSDYDGRASLALPYSLRLGWSGLRQHVLVERGLTLFELRPPPEWVKYGADPRTPAAFEANVREIASLADERKQRLVLMTFASYVPENYDLDAFLKHELDYCLHHSPLEIWGAPEHVVATLALHNDVIRKIAAERGGRDFVEQVGAIPPGEKYFHDVCHLTDDGSRRFVQNIFAAIPPRRWCREEPR